jgi:hypothetical protein
VSPTILHVLGIEGTTRHHDATPLQKVLGPVGLASFDGEKQTVSGEASAPDLDAISEKEPLYLDARPTTIAGNVESPGVASRDALEELVDHAGYAVSLVGGGPIGVCKGGNNSIEPVDPIQMGYQFQ